MQRKNYIIRKAEKAVAGLAKKSAGIEANSTCAVWGYQPKEPEALKKLRKF